MQLSGFSQHAGDHGAAGVTSAPAPPVVACGSPARRATGWQYDAFIGGLGVEARMTAADSQDPLLVVADKSGLAAYSPMKGLLAFLKYPAAGALL